MVFKHRIMVYHTPRFIIVGIQGTGKSLTAKAIATEWQLPLLKLDVGKLFGGIVGESESRLRQMIEVLKRYHLVYYGLMKLTKL